LKKGSLIQWPLFRSSQQGNTIIMTAIPFTQQNLLCIVTAASTIDERLGNGFLPDNAGASDEIANARLNEWCRAVAKGDWERFRERLSWDGLDVDTVRLVLGAVRLREGTLHPQWMDILSEALSLTAVMQDDETENSKTDNSRLSFLDPMNPLPFEEVLVPFVVVAREKLTSQSGAAYHLLEEEAHVALQRNLLQTLTAYSAQALNLEFSIKRALEQSPLQYLFAQVQNENERILYQQFIEWMHRGGLTVFFQEYTVLARLLATITDFWIEANVEFLQRLSSDWSEIQRIFGSDGELGQVTTVQPSLSDPHRGRRSVIALTFTSGRKLVYKPKDLGMEEAWNGLLAWLNQWGAPLPFQLLTLINRSSHGWVEFVEHKTCKDQEEVHRYYRRAGMLLCLVYVLEGTDCHYENIIACGEYPVLIDMETLMHHGLRREDVEEGTLAQFLAQEHFVHSVLRTGLLPSWQISNDGRSAYDVSGLGGSSEQEFQVQVPKWEHVNTDRMVLAYEPAKMRTPGPIMNGIPFRLEEHAQDVVKGFQQLYRFLLQYRESLLALESPLYGIAHQQVRFVYRNTYVYGSIFQKLLNPRYLRDGADRSIQLELLGRAVIPFEGPLREKGKKFRRWPIFAAERQAMEQCDVPLFTARADSDTLIIAAGQEIEECLEEPSFNRVMAGLKALGEEDLEQQIGFIQGSLYTYVARNLPSMPTRKSMHVDAHPEASGQPTSDKLVAQVLTIAEQLAAQAIRATDGSMAWIAPQYLMQAERYQLQPIGYDLYGGTCGVALFLAAVEKITGGAGYRELALGSVQSLRQALRHYGQRTARELGIGGAAGLGSVVYTLTRASQLLDEPTLLADAMRAAMLITHDRIAGANNPDILAGVAGAALGLLALYDVSSEQAVLDRAVACGQYLLQTRTESEVGCRAWPTLDGNLLTGFSHGAAGIAYALLRLYAVTKDAALLEAAREGIAYEDSTFSSEVGNWPDLRAEEHSTFMTSWCHGAPGIGLARIGGLSILDTTRIREDIETAVQTTQRFGVQGPDHLCCGNLGRADVLLVAASRLSCAELSEAARRVAWQVVAEAEQTGSFLLHPLLPRQVYSPGFFQGSAGIGYMLLRIVHPGVLPSVLLWE
jgi:type 2 lantibiotic biosynthesis protein LanM